LTRTEHTKKSRVDLKAQVGNFDQCVCLSPYLVEVRRSEAMKVVLSAIALSATMLASGVSAASAQSVINLSGQWQCVASCIAPPANFAYITQNGWDLNVVNEAGMPSRAWVDYPGHIWIDRANQGAVYSPDGFTLQFDSGTVWQRAAVLPPPYFPNRG
jgi:hypothetical protein